MSGAGSAFERPIRVAYRPSLRVMILLFVMHVGAFAAVALSGIPAPAGFAVAALVLASLITQSRRMAREFLAPEPPVLQLDGRDEWRLLRPGGNDRMIAGDDSVALPWLVVLHLRDTAGAHRFFILTRDNTPPDTLRRLCVRLRYPLRPE